MSSRKKEISSIHVRIDNDTHEKVVQKLEKVGLTPAKAITLLYTSIEQNHKLPFEIDSDLLTKMENAYTLKKKELKREGTKNVEKDIQVNIDKLKKAEVRKFLRSLNKDFSDELNNSRLIRYFLGLILYKEYNLNALKQETIHKNVIESIFKAIPNEKTVLSNVPPDLKPVMVKIRDNFGDDFMIIPVDDYNPIFIIASNKSLVKKVYLFDVDKRIGHKHLDIHLHEYFYKYLKEHYIEHFVDPMTKEDYSIYKIEHILQCYALTDDYVIVSFDYYETLGLYRRVTQVLGSINDNSFIMPITERDEIAYIMKKYNIFIHPEMKKYKLYKDEKERVNNAKEERIIESKPMVACPIDEVAFDIKFEEGDDDDGLFDGDNNIQGPDDVFEGETWHDWIDFKGTD